MLEKLLSFLQTNSAYCDTYKSLFREQNIPAGVILLREGETSSNLYFVKKGCLRLWFNDNGKDITFQFFFENEAVSSLLGREPSLFYVESVEPATIVMLGIDNFKKLLKEIPELKDGFVDIVVSRLENYARLFLSRIKDSPAKRYTDLLSERPEIIKRIPQHYIASYLGITPVSLSRIRRRIKT